MSARPSAGDSCLSVVAAGGIFQTAGLKPGNEYKLHFYASLFVVGKKKLISDIAVTHTHLRVYREMFICQRQQGRDYVSAGEG